MLQFPGFMRQFPWSTRMIPSSFLLPSQYPHPFNGDTLIAMEESEFEEKCNEIRTTNRNLTVIGKTTVEEYREDYDNGGDDEDVDNGEDSEGDDYQQEETS